MNFSFFILTQSTSLIIGPIANIFGKIMNAIYNFFFSSFGVVSVGITIIVFTIIVRLLMLPLAVKQQKSMKDMQKVQPELKKIQEKYKNLKDPESQKKMQMETTKLYQDYNVSPFGGCLPLMIQMPILFALFAVLRNIPAYIGQVKEVYISLLGKLSAVPSYETIIEGIHTAQKVKIKNFDIGVQDKVIDLLSSLNSAGWLNLKESFSSIAEQITPLIDRIGSMNYFFGINLSDTPINLSAGVQGLMTPGILIPILCFAAQLLVSKTTNTGGGSKKDNPQDQTSQTMMKMMPFITVMFVIGMPAGLGIYWLTSNVFQAIQQVVINHYLKDKN